METIRNVGFYLSSAFIIFGGGLAYIPQTFQISRRGSAQGFSTLTCLILLTANTVRLFFWYGVRFESQLLAQSVYMFVVMLGVMWVCVRAGGEREERRIWGRGFYKHFWRWTRFTDYLTFTTGLIALLAFITFLTDTDGYYTVLGYVALVTESGTGLPQLLGNWSSRSTQGMSVTMVLLWLFGDLYKTSYFIVRETPIQFLVCGGTQVILDLMLLMQVAWYRGDNKPEISI